MEELQKRGHAALLRIKKLRADLEQQRSDLATFKESLEQLQTRQEQQEATLLANKQSKESVLELTREQETQYQSLLQESKAAHQAANAEIKRLDVEIREELRRQGRGNLPSVGVLDWPVEPIFGIACGFHCPGYPYAYLIGPHSGIDIPTYVGTPIKAPADGYVGRVHQGTGAGYSYLMLLHGDNVSTVYGHLSGFNVSEGKLVNRGSVLGYSGGAPGSPGSGLSTGAHLHFEVRVNNRAVDPQNYL